MTWELTDLITQINGEGWQLYQLCQSDRGWRCYLRRAYCIAYGEAFSPADAVLAAMENLDFEELPSISVQSRDEDITHIVLGTKIKRRF